MRINREEVEFHPTSFCDGEGRLFRWRGTLYRGISPRSAPRFERLLEEGVFDELSRAGLLVATRRADVELDGFALVLEHAAVARVSYPCEWSLSMLRDAGLLVLELLDALASRGLGLTDAAAWNVLFDGTRPLWVDVASLTAAGDTEASACVARDLRGYYLEPARLIAAGLAPLARALLERYEGGSTPALIEALEQARALTAEDAGEAARVALTRRAREAALSWRSGAAAYAETVRDELAAMPSLEPPPDPDDTPLPATQREALARVLGEHAPGSTLALGARAGLALASLDAGELCVVDTDERAVDSLYVDARSRGSAAMLPLVVDPTCPTPGRGLANRALPPACERLRSELVVAPDVSGAFALARAHVPLDRVAAALAAFGGELLVVGTGDTTPALRAPGSWFDEPTLDRLTRALQQRYQRVTALGDSGLLLCELAR